MGMRTELRRLLLERKIFLHKATVTETLRNFVTRFSKNYRAVELLRVGPKFDGGYLVPDILDEIDLCFSAGVGHTSDFEKDLYSNYRIRSFMLDASVEFPRLEGDFFEFQKKFLGVYDSDDVITMGSWLEDHASSESDKLLLQMDIEGSEYEILAFEPNSVLSRFSCMVIEFHDFHKLFDPNFCFFLNGIFEKIYKDFSIVHAHASSYRKLIKNDGIGIPPTIEITFLRNDVLKGLVQLKEPNLPHPLDNPNSPKHKGINLPEIWWKS